MVTELLRGGLEQDAGLILGQRRQRILALARCLERVAAVDPATPEIAGLARNAEVVFDPVVPRLQFRVGQRPVGERRTLRER
jgi:hypothetical protein